jgi:hypothetical protein
MSQCFPNSSQQSDIQRACEPARKEQKYGQGSQQGQKQRMTMLMKASSKLLLCSNTEVCDEKALQPSNETMMTEYQGSKQEQPDHE